MKIEDQLLAKFACAKCKHKTAKAKKIAATGTGLSKLLDIQHNRFLGLSCQNCGYTDFFDLHVLEGQKSLGTILDVIFER
jgi:predicted nucleic-acid-binding Zn-ribbon protein